MWSPKREARLRATRATVSRLERELEDAAMEYPADRVKIARLSAALLRADDRARKPSR